MTAAPTRVAIGTLVVAARSAVEARRLADRLPAAIEQALAARRAGGTTGPRRIDAGELRAGTPDLARAVAERIVAAALPGAPR